MHGESAVADPQISHVGIKNASPLCWTEGRVGCCGGSSNRANIYGRTLRPMDPRDKLPEVVGRVGNHRRPHDGGDLRQNPPPLPRRGPTTLRDCAHKSSDACIIKGMGGGEGDPRPSHVRDGASPDSAERPSVLIVDDTAANLLAFSSVLEPEGYDLFTAKSGQEALMLALRQEFAVILLDVRMPGMDGIETATFLRAGRGRFTPIIFVSAHDNTPF